MRFTIEQRHLTDRLGRPIGAYEPVSFHVREADTADDVVGVFAREHHAEIIGDVLKFPGFQAVATMRSPEGVFTLQIAPTSQQIRIR